MLACFRILALAFYVGQDLRIFLHTAGEVCNLACKAGCVSPIGE